MISLALEFEKYASNSFLQVKWLQLFIFYPSLNGWFKSTNTRCLDDVCSRCLRCFAYSPVIFQGGGPTSRRAAVHYF